MVAAPLRFGIVGACGRGGSFGRVFQMLEGARIHAVCDIRQDELHSAAERLGAEQEYVDYERMLDESGIDAVVIGTPMPLHVPQAIAALQRGIHVLSEVPAGVSIEECRELVRVCRASDAIYMMAENYVYTRPNILVRELVRQGLFGQTYFADGEYLHELKGLNEITRWRRRWQTGIDGITYGTHSLGPILGWMPGDRVERVCCAGSGHHYRDPRGDLYENQDSCVMLCQMHSGGLVKIRVDMLSDRPHAMANYQLQGTDGCYESARWPGGRHRIWLRSRCPEPNVWHDLEEFAEFLPASWLRREEQAHQTGHGGGDFYVISDFVEAILENKEPPIGIDEAMDMTLPGLVSQQSIAEGGRWLPVPDSRAW
ncbi:MAG: Gfo/Idh/MocA family oxidoreductase [Chloroflexi bacterium]|nr:Gfo/Idh/MocA family oxidoreductase [Chloroflexota bacterium]